jgi:hypothetical protein
MAEQTILFKDAKLTVGHSIPKEQTASKESLFILLRSFLIA